MFVALRDESHFCQYADTQTQLNISLDHIGINRGQRNVRLDVSCLEGGIDLAATAKREIVGDDRVLRDLRQRQFFLC